MEKVEIGQVDYKGRPLNEITKDGKVYFVNMRNARVQFNSEKAAKRHVEQIKNMKKNLT